MDGDRQSRIRSFVQDSALGRWRMDLCRPRAQLAPFVGQLWYGQGQVNYRRDRILPGGGGFLLAQPADGSSRLYDFFVQTPARPRALDDVEFFPIDADFGEASRFDLLRLAGAGTRRIGPHDACERVAEGQDGPPA